MVRARYQILSLIAAGLDNQALVLSVCCVNRLPCILHMANLIILNGRISLSPLSRSVLLLAHKPHRQLADLDAGVGAAIHILLMNNIVDLLFSSIVILILD